PSIIMSKATAAARSKCERATMSISSKASGAHLPPFSNLGITRQSRYSSPNSLEGLGVGAVLEKVPLRKRYLLDERSEQAEPLASWRSTATLEWDNPVSQRHACEPIHAA